MKSAKEYLSNVPLIALLVANVVPVAGVLFLGWDAFYIVLFTILKMACVNVPHPAAHLGKLFAIPFFMVHYGGFTAVHGLLVLGIFKKGSEGLGGGADWPCFLVFVQMLFNVIREAYSIMPPHMRLAMAALFASHGISFVYNYLIKGEYAVSNVNALMAEPYGRVVVMHIAIFAGGFFAMSLGSPVALLLALVVLKTVVDVKLHQREHQKKQKRLKTAAAQA
ncbi:MAG: DUF6498-containing protein [Planctomycetota bacterium]|jgi:hypothetical protein